MQFPLIQQEKKKKEGSNNYVYPTEKLITYIFWKKPVTSLPYSLSSPPCWAGELQTLDTGLEVGSASQALGTHVSPPSKGGFAGDIICPKSSPQWGWTRCDSHPCHSQPNPAGQSGGDTLAGVMEGSKSRVRVSLNGSAVGPCQGGGSRRRSYGRLFRLNNQQTAVSG